MTPPERSCSTIDGLWKMSALHCGFGFRHLTKCGVALLIFAIKSSSCCLNSLETDFFFAAPFPAAATGSAPFWRLLRTWTKGLFDEAKASARRSLRESMFLSIQFSVEYVT